MLHLLIAGALAIAAPQQLDTTIAVRSGGRLEIDSYAGAVTIRPWNRNDVRIQASHGTRDGVEIDHSGNTVSIDASDDAGSEIRFTINVPKSFRVNVDGVNTTVDLSGTEGDVNISTVQGNVAIRDVTGRVEAETVSGVITIDGVRGNVTASGTNQGLRLSNIAGDIDVEAMNGSITMLGIQSGSVQAETVNGSIVLGTTIRDGGSYELSTTNGSVTLGVPEATNATFEISTYNGKLETTLPLKTGTRRSGGSSFHLGSGSAHIELDTFAGTIRLVRPEELRGIPDAKNKNED